MTKQEWFEVVKNHTVAAGTYQTYFEPVIDTLAEILDKRDLALAEFYKTGGKVLVAHTNKGGNKNIEQNPALRLVNDLNRDALTYWRDLGLTPAGLRKLNADVVQDKNAGSFEKLLGKITG